MCETEGECVNYDDSKLERSALSFRLAPQSTSLRREALLSRRFATQSERLYSCADLLHEVRG